MAESSPLDHHAVVSSEDEPLILVDETDNEIGFMSKGACHDGDGVLHRAFSLFVFNSEGELLLQQRSAEKRLWPLFWSNPFTRSTGQVAKLGFSSRFARSGRAGCY